jgi:hypothetical protein
MFNILAKGTLPMVLRLALHRTVSTWSIILHEIAHGKSAEKKTKEN